MNERKPDELDEPDELDGRLAKLDRDVEPSRDLWPDIAAVLAASAAPADRAPLNVLRLPTRTRRFDSTRWGQLAAAALLMVTSSALTYVLMQRSLQGQVTQARQEVMQQMQPVLPATPVSFGARRFGYGRLGSEYASTHAELNAQFTRYLEALPSVERVKVERSLADLRRAASELSERLDEHPSDPLLQELLLSTYQNEIGLLTRFNSTALGADL
jgi:hypothetical protein